MLKHNSFISNFKNSVFNVILKFTLLFGILLFLFFRVVAPEYENGFCASLLDKANRLKSIEEPKIVLIGNSNIAFGIRSQIIEEATGMPVVNMGLHGGLGNEFHENMAKLNVTPGDIYVIGHSSFEEEEGIEQPSLAWITIENHWDLYGLVPDHQWYEMLKAFPTYVKKSLTLFLNDDGNGIVDSCYSRYAFNEYGDNVYSATHEDPFAFPEDYVPAVPMIDDSCAKRLNALNRYLNSRGASMVVGAYPIASNQETDRDAFSEVRSQLQSKLDCAVISDYTDYLFPYEDFYGTILHLNDDAAERRSVQLAEDLKGYLAEYIEK